MLLFLFFIGCKGNFYLRWISILQFVWFDSLCYFFLNFQIFLSCFTHTHRYNACHKFLQPTFFFFDSKNIFSFCFWKSHRNSVSISTFNRKWYTVKRILEKSIWLHESNWSVCLFQRWKSSSKKKKKQQNISSFCCCFSFTHSLLFSSIKSIDRFYNL